MEKRRPAWAQHSRSTSRPLGSQRDPSRAAAKSRRPDRTKGFLAEADAILGTSFAESEEAVAAAQATAMPDSAALGYLRTVESAKAKGVDGDLAAALRSPGAGERQGLLGRLLLIGGSSEALVDHLVRHPEAALQLTGGGRLIIGTPSAEAGALRASLLEAVGAKADDPEPVAALTGDDGKTALRARYRDHVMRLVVDDLADEDPRTILEEVCRILADLAGAAIEAGLAVARAEIDPERTTQLAAIAMGKCGARELNYVSDVDVVWTHAAGDGSAPGPEHTRIAEAMASRTTELMGGSGQEPALWELDAALRPEGKAGRLVRSVEDFATYYENVAETWEFQALLKARPVAGTASLGRRWAEACAPFVWTVSTREGFVDGVRRMRARVVELLSKDEAARQIKLGRGGLRDVEFSAQLLQLVHGPDDDAIRTPGTLAALRGLGDRGYIGTAAAETLSDSYRRMRIVEHRLQIPRLLRTALLPTREDRKRELARLVYPGGDRSGERLEKNLTAIFRSVRSLHESIFYRPILDAAVSEHAITSLSPEAARSRLAAFGYRDPKSAFGHIIALSQGVSRENVIHRQVMPAMLGWLSEGVDPDAGLLAFRRLGESLSGSAWYLRILRDSGSAVHQLAQVLSLSQFATEQLLHIPTAVAWFDDEEKLRPRSAQAIRTEAETLLRRRGAEAGPSLRSLYGAERLRTAIGDILGVIPDDDVPGQLSAIADVYIDSVLTAVRKGLDEKAGISDYEFAVIAMGRLGGSEIGYFSDADVMFAYRPTAGELDAEARGKLAGHVKKLALALSAEANRAAPVPGIEVDADLRPEGRAGALVRTFDSYASYYAKWSEPWEAQALLRARVIAGDEALAEDFVELIDPLRYPDELPEASLRQMRRLKARMESERLPRGADPTKHLKLGRGGLSDVEWTVQLLQMQHAHTVGELKTTSTLPALAAAVDAELMSAEDAETLRAAWLFATGLRSAAMLYRGRTAESLPANAAELEACARLLGYEPDSSLRLVDDYMGRTRRARRVVEQVFFGYADDEEETAVRYREHR